jgi:hypothetical protein
LTRTAAVRVFLLTFSLFFAAPLSARPRIDVSITSDKAEYEIFEEALFRVEIRSRRNPRSMEIRASFPDASTEVSLARTGNRSFEYATGSLEETGEKTLTVSLYRKNTSRRISFFETRRHHLLCLLGLYESLSAQFPFLARFFRIKIRVIRRLIERVERMIDRLKTPLAEATKTIRVRDTVPPETVHDYAHDGEWVNGDVTVHLAATDAGTGVSETFYRIGDGEIQTGTVLSVTQEGTFAVTFWSEDNAGNVEPENTLTVKRDKTPPVVSIREPSDGFSTPAETVMVRGTVEEGHLESVSVNGTAADVEDGAFSAGVPLIFGENLVTATARDRAGNEASVSVRVIREEPALPPTLAISSPAEGETFDHPFPVLHAEWEPGTDPIDPSTADIRVDGQSITALCEIDPEGAFYEYTQQNPLGNGPHTLSVSIRDTGGLETSASVSFTVDAAEILPPPEVVEESSFLTGRVVHARTGEPLHGVKVTINGNTADAVYTSSTGYYTYPVSRTGMHALLIEHPGFSYSVKKIDIRDPGFDHTMETARLVPIDPAVATIGSEGGTYVHSRGLIEVDVPAGALPPGQTIDARSIWYESEDEIPAKMPRTIAFTYCIELLPDGAEFDVPVTVRHRNTRGFAAGTQIPVGCFDRETARWHHETMAEVDPTGQWLEFQVSHFTPYDCNVTRRDLPLPDFPRFFN